MILDLDQSGGHLRRQLAVIDRPQGDPEIEMAAARSRRWGNCEREAEIRIHRDALAANQSFIEGRRATPILNLAGRSGGRDGSHAYVKPGVVTVTTTSPT
jgi:hypothetical protein